MLAFRPHRARSTATAATYAVHRSISSSSSSSSSGSSSSSSSSTFDNSEALARLACPASRFVLLRPPGFGAAPLHRGLARLFGPKEARAEALGPESGCWLARNRPQLLRQPAFPVLHVDLEAAVRQADSSAAVDGAKQKGEDDEAAAVAWAARVQEAIVARLHFWCGDFGLDLDTHAAADTVTDVDTSALGGVPRVLR